MSDSATPATTAGSDAKSDAQNEEFVLTSEIMAYENGRHDTIISAGVLLFAFFLGCFRDTYPDIPLRLATGQLIVDSGIPKTDPFTFGAPQDKTWVNPSWLFDLIAFRTFDTLGEVPLSVLKALCGALAVLPFLFVRYRGPTLWWTAVCTFLAGAAAAPRFFLGPEVMTLPLLSALMLCWFSARYLGRQWALYLSIPIALFWANIDSSFFIGAITLLVLGLGEVVHTMLPRSLSFGDRSPSIQLGLTAVVLGAVFLLAGAATPYGMATLTFPFEWVNHVLPQAAHAEREFFGWNGLLAPMREGRPETTFFARLLDGNLSYAETAWVVLVIGSAASFFLNFGRFNVSRVLLWIAAIVLPVVAARYTAPSAFLLAYALSLNAQEAFIDAFGTEVRITRGWVLYSQIGRMLTIVMLFIAVLMAPTGRIVPSTMGLFGFGLARDEFPDPAACKWLKDAQFTGNSFIPSAVRLPAGLAFETPDVKYFIDSRWQLFADAPTEGGDSPLQEYTRVQKALLEDDPDPRSKKEMDEWRATWSTFFEKHRVSYVMYDPTREVNIGVLRALIPNVKTLLITDRMIVVGRGDLSKDHPDIAKFDKLQLNTNKLAFDPPPVKKDELSFAITSPPAEARPSVPPTIIDWLWRMRYSRASGVVSGNSFIMLPYNLDPPGNLFLAVHQLRKAASEQPDSPRARAMLASVYDVLYSREVGVLDMGLDAQFQAVERERRKLKKARGETTTTTKKSDPEKSETKDGKKSAPEPVSKKSDEKNADGKKSEQKENGLEKRVDNTAPKKDELEERVDHPLLRARESRSVMPLRHFQIMCGIRDTLRSFTPEGFNSYLFSPDPSQVPTLDFERMAQRCASNGYLDQTLEIYRISLSKLDSSEYRDRISQTALALEKQVETTSARIEEEIARRQQMIAQQSPELAGSNLLLMRIQLYRNNGLPLKAISIFESAAPTDPELEYAKIYMAELYMEMGFTEKASQMLATLQRNLMTRVGDYEYLSAQAQLSAGQYDEAKRQIEAAIAQIQQNRTDKALTTLENLVTGSPLVSLGQQGEFAGPLMSAGEVFSDLQREAHLHFEYGLILLEMGKPADAAKAFGESLRANPRLLWRPIMEDYCKYIKGAKLPDAPPPYLPEEQELTVKFESKPDAKESTPAAKTADALKITPQPAKKTPEPAKKTPDSTKKN